MFGPLVLLSLPASLHAQTMNPTTAQFVASADQNSTAADGTPLVTGYELDFYMVGAAQPFQTLPIGKPVPDATGNISVNFLTLLGSALPVGTVYDATVVAVGPGGSSASTVSNTFEYASVSCSYGVSPTSAAPGSAGGAASLTMTTTSGCSWTAASNASWLTITGGASGSDSGTVSYTAAVNTATSPRTGTLTVAGQTVTITQSAAACGFSVSPTSAAPGSAGGTANIAVTTTSGCSWTAASNAGWLTIAGGASGSDSGTVNYTTAVNTATSPRTGTLTVAGQTVTITQSAAACGYSVSPLSATPGSAGGADSLSVTTTGGCSWTAKSNKSWITVTGGASGSGSGTVTYTTAANTLTSARTGTLTVAGQTITITQGAAACGYSVSPTAASPGSTGGAASVTVTTTSGCAWTAASNAAWLTITSGASGSGAGTVSYSAAANPSRSSRVGTLTVATQTVTVTESAAVITTPAPPSNVRIVPGK